MKDAEQYDSPTAKGLVEPQDALRAAEENVTKARAIRDERTLERDQARRELQRLRERSSVELAEAKVTQARLQRNVNQLALKVSQLEAECGTLRLEVDHLRTARGDFINTLTALIQAHDQTSEA